MQVENKDMPKKKIYDINFRPVATAVFTVSAVSMKQAREIAEEELDKMPKEELIELLLDAVQFEGLKITKVSYVDDDDPMA